MLHRNLSDGCGLFAVSAGLPSEGRRRLVVQTETDAVVHRALHHRRPQATEEPVPEPLSAEDLAQGVHEASFGFV